MKVCLVRFASLFLGIFAFTLIEANTISCYVPKNMLMPMHTLFDTTMEPLEKSFRFKIVFQAYSDNQNIFKSLTTNPVEFAIVRADILYDQNKLVDKKSREDSYITLSTLPYKAQLFLIQNKEETDMTLQDLSQKVVSVGKLNQHNGALLNNLLNMHYLNYTVQYKSFSYEDSLLGLKKNKLYAFFGFLPDFLENNYFHFQKTFSDKTTYYLKNKNIYDIDYLGIKIPYLLIANHTTSDKEIEDIIYRLISKKIFQPVTDKKYGPINHRVNEHIAHIQSGLVKPIKIVTVEESQTNEKSSSECIQYHHGFLNLLKQKPSLKKKVRIIRYKRPSQYKSAKKYLRALENILLTIDKEQASCDSEILKENKEKFRQIAYKIKAIF